MRILNRADLIFCIAILVMISSVSPMVFGSLIRSSEVSSEIKEKMYLDIYDVKYHPSDLSRYVLSHCRRRDDNKFCSVLLDEKYPSGYSSDPFLGGNVFYVGGGGPDNYTRIQDAIDNASDGDTVFVFSGHYFETLEVNKSLEIVGEDRNTTIVDGDNASLKDVFLLLKGGTTIHGFTLQYSGAQASGIAAFSDNNHIYDCILFENLESGFVTTGDNNVVSDCYFRDNHWGLWIHEGTHNLISNCIFNGNSILIYFAEKNAISGCEIFDCVTGIELHVSDEHSIIDCNFHNNLWGLDIVDSGRNHRIENCVFVDNEYEGFRADGLQENFTLHNCTFSNPDAVGMSFDGSVIDSIVSQCTFIENIYGLWFFGGLKRVEVSECHFENNTYGIDLFYNNFFNMFYSNNFIDNEYHIATQSPGSKLRFMFNFYKNNYWDDYDGTGWYHVYGWLNWDFHPAQEPYSITD